MPTGNSVRIPSIIHNSEDSQKVIPGYHGRVHCRRQLSRADKAHFGEWEPSQGGTVGGSLAYPAAALIHTNPAGSAAASYPLLISKPGRSSTAVRKGTLSDPPNPAAQPSEMSPLKAKISPVSSWRFPSILPHCLKHEFAVFGIRVRVFRTCRRANGVPAIPAQARPGRGRHGSGLAGA